MVQIIDVVCRYCVSYIYVDCGHIRICDDDDCSVKSGRLEFQLENGTWGTVSEYGFHKEAAGVACRQLGYQSGDVLEKPQ